MLIKHLASHSDDLQLFQSWNTLDYKSYKKAEFIELYFILTELKLNFKTKLEAYEVIKRHFRAMQRGIAFAKYGGDKPDTTQLIRLFNDYLKTSV